MHVKRHRNHLSALSVSIILLYLIAGCGKHESANGPHAGEWRYEIVVRPYDEFNRRTIRTTPCRVSVVGPEFSTTVTVSPAESLAVVDGVPDADHLVTAEADGYNPSWTWVIDQLAIYPSRRVDLLIHQCLSAASRIDSIECVVNTVTPQLRIRCFTSNVLPADGARSCIAYIGLTASVSPRPGDYVYTTEYFSQQPGTNVALSREFYRVLHSIGAATGTRLYVTARLSSPSETNSSARSSFIMP